MGDERCRLDLAVLGGNGSCAGVEVEVRSPTHSLTSKERAEGRSVNNKPFEAVWSSRGRGGWR